MDGVISAQALGTFFALAPLVLGLGIYFVAWLAKRHEGATFPALGATSACAACGRRGSREHMVPQNREGAIGYVCAHCA